MSEKQKELLVLAIENSFVKGIPISETLEINSDAMEHLYTQAYNLFSAHKYTDAAKLFQVLYILNPQDSRYSLGLGATYQMAKDYVNAIGWYLVLAIVDEETPLAFYYISDCYLKQDQPTLSIAFLKKTMERCGSNTSYQSLKMRAELMIASLEEEITKKKPLDKEAVR